MIYFDNSATTLRKPPEVSRAVSHAIRTLGNPGRSFFGPSLSAARAVAGARAEIAALTGAESPLHVAFTSGATESLNLVLGGLLSAGDHVITTVLEHNSVLRPLYNTGCALSFLDCDDAGRLRLETLPGLLRGNTRALVCAHGSNLLGTLADTDALYAFCKEKGLLFVLDAAQTLGCCEVRADMADMLCFTGHKALFGPQGTGGIIARHPAGLRLRKTGGAGSHTFEPHQPLQMPDFFEAGTQNTHGLAGLQKGAEFVARQGLASIEAAQSRLLRLFWEGARTIGGLFFYGAEPHAGEARLPIVPFNLNDLPAEEVTRRLWVTRRIASRAGGHCAPLAHRRFQTERRGMVRFSFSMFNTEEEIRIALEALRGIASR